MRPRARNSKSPAATSSEVLRYSAAGIWQAMNWRQISS
jgi:hypothetical protein